MKLHNSVSKKIFGLFEKGYVIPLILWLAMFNTVSATDSNLSLNSGSTATASTEQLPNNPASNTKDNNGGTRWCASSNANGEWLKMDLGANYTINSTEVCWEQTAVYKYKVEVSSDNTNWILKIDKTGNTASQQTISDPFSPTVQARYVRITATGLPSGQWASIFEFRVFGSSGNVAPTITAQPTNQTVTEGNTATFSITATGTPAPTYQWRKNGSDIAGATSNTYTTPITTIADNGQQFSCVVTNLVTSVTSNNALLTVNYAAPVISQQPLPQSVNASTTATFAITASCMSGTLTYKWRKNGTDIQNTNSNTYTTPTTILADNGAQFSCVVTNPPGNGSVASNNALLTVTNAPVAPTITTQPVSQSVNVNQPATFTVVATGNPSPSYQWLKNGLVIPGAVSPSYTTPPAIVADNGALFSCVVYNTSGSVNSSAATLSIIGAPTITGQPSNQVVAEGKSATFSITAGGNGLSYQWKKNGVDIAGATSSSYTTPVSALSDNGTLYSCVVTNNVGSVTSNAATLMVFSCCEQINGDWSAIDGAAKILNKPPVYTDANNNCGIGTAAALNQKLVVNGGDVKIMGSAWGADGNTATTFLGDENHYIRSTFGTGVQIGTFQAADALTLTQTTGDVTVTKGNLVVTNGKIKIKSWSIQEPDYVFEKGYNLPKLNDVEKFVQDNKHLPEVPSAAEMKQNGMDLTEMNFLLLKKVEELTRYTIEQNKRIEALEKRVKEGTK